MDASVRNHAAIMMEETHTTDRQDECDEDTTGEVTSMECGKFKFAYRFRTSLKLNSSTCRGLNGNYRCYTFLNDSNTADLILCQALLLHYVPWKFGYGKVRVNQGMVMHYCRTTPDVHGKFPLKHFYTWRAISDRFKQYNLLRKYVESNTIPLTGDSAVDKLLEEDNGTSETNRVVVLLWRAIKRVLASQTEHHAEPTQPQPRRKRASKNNADASQAQSSTTQSIASVNHSHIGVASINCGSTASVPSIIITASSQSAAAVANNNQDLIDGVTCMEKRFTWGCAVKTIVKSRSGNYLIFPFLNDSRTADLILCQALLLHYLPRKLVFDEEQANKERVIHYCRTTPDVHGKFPLQKIIDWNTVLYRFEEYTFLKEYIGNNTIPLSGNSTVDKLLEEDDGISETNRVVVQLWRALKRIFATTKVRNPELRNHQQENEQESTVSSNRKRIAEDDWCADADADDCYDADSNLSEESSLMAERIEAICNENLILNNQRLEEERKQMEEENRRAKLELKKARIELEQQQTEILRQRAQIELYKQQLDLRHEYHNYHMS